MSKLSSEDRFGPVVPEMPATAPSYDVKLQGRLVSIVPVHPDHAADLYEHVSGPENAHLFDYLFDTPPESLDAFRTRFAGKAETTNPWTYTILLNATSKPVGILSLMRMDLPNRVVEIGSVLYTPALQRTPAATELQYLLAKYVFEQLGFRRYEWKCNDLNVPSKRAAKRLGFKYEGTFRQHMIVRGRNRNTAWFSIIDEEWPGVKKGFEGWLDVNNFDKDGGQKKGLEEFRE